MPLSVETGRFVGEKHCDRICTLCSSGSVEDEIHFIFHCCLYDNQREDLNIKATNVVERGDGMICQILKSLVIYSIT